MHGELSVPTSGRSAPPPAERAPEAPLGLHEELWDPNAVKCVCGPAHLRLRSEHGELVAPRGKSVNRCDYCARLAAVENCEMLALDALEGDAPAVLLVLGTRTATVDMEGFYAGHKQVKKAVKRRWPSARFAVLLEFTTGYGERSGGLRRPHWNYLVKGVPGDQADELLAVAARIWCQHVDAVPHAQEARSIYSAGGLMKYLALHFQKASQEPPANFTGQRFNCSRDYFTTVTRATARARARESLRLKREVWKAMQRAEAIADARGEEVDALEVELDAQLAHRRNLATRWVLASETGARLSDTALPKTNLAGRLRLVLHAP